MTEAGGLAVPEDWVLKDCASVTCDQTVWVPDVAELVPVCSARCAVDLIDQMELVTLLRAHQDTPECWCAPVIHGIEHEGAVRWTLQHNT